MRKMTKEVIIGKGNKQVKIGNLNKIAIQSMCNTKTSDIASTVNQINELEKVGCNIIRVAVLNLDDAYAIKEIVKEINIPLVADIHYDYKLAIAAIESGCDKIRLNPGNIGNIDNVKKVVDKCKEFQIPIRIGVNLGSLNKDIEEKYGRCAKALFESAKEHVEILESLDFYNIVISLKASDLKTSIEAYELASSYFNYPLHIGITESGTKYSGTIKSSIGLGVLLNKNIGDTIRVSLSDEPIEEIKAAKEILSALNLYSKPIITSCPTCGRTNWNLIDTANEIERWVNSTFPNELIHIAIMGCAVNGPGEAKDADIGIAGGNNEVLLFKKGEIIKKIKGDNIIIEFKNEIRNMIENKNCII